MNEIGEECKRGIIIGKDFSEKALKLAEEKKIYCFRFLFSKVNNQGLYTFESLLNKLNLNLINP